jgi:hypothetical protein
MHGLDKGLAVAIGQFGKNDLQGSFATLWVHVFRVLRGIVLEMGGSEGRRPSSKD